MSDRQWAASAVGCVIGGALIAVLTGKTRWFAMGGLLGTTVIGYRLYTNSKESSQNLLHHPPVLANKFLDHVMKEKPEFETLGAPEIPAVEVPHAGMPQPQTRSGVEGYPMAFRVPDTEVHIDTMDDRIRPHYTGPLGPENDPVRYW